MLVRSIALAVLFGLLTAPPLQAQDPLAAARDLYASAQYDEALSVLDRLSDAALPNDQRQSIDLYRSLCLLAVGRRDDADRAIESIIARDPFYRPDADLPPRTRASFSDVKKRVLPAVVQRRYEEAQSTFERGEFETAAEAFQRVIDALADPDLGVAASQPPLSDLRTLAIGFHKLSVKSIPPPPPPPPPAPVVAPEPERPVPVPPRIYAGEEAGVRPPVTVAQELPRYPGVVPFGGIKGIVEVVIDEKGSVESAAMVMPVSHAYDKVVLAAVHRWQYRPATMNGVAVKFRKRVQINIAPSTQ